MNLEKRKYKIIEKLMEVNDEVTIYNLSKILNLIENDFSIPEHHIEIIDARLDSYSKNTSQIFEWNDLKNQW